MKIQLSVSLLIILLSCCHSEKQLSKGDQDWFSVYRKGKSLVFKSNLGNFDTIGVFKTSDTHDNKKLFGSKENSNKIILVANPCKNKTQCNVEVSMNADGETQNFPSFTAFGLTYDINLNKSQPSVESITLNSTKKKYRSAYNFEDGVNAYNSGKGYLKSFYWDKKEGLILYDTSEGEVFELLKIIK